MKRSGTPLIRALEHFSEQVSDGLAEGKRRLCQLPVVGSTFSKIFQRLPLHAGKIINIVITSLSYTGVYLAQHNYALELQGANYDFVLPLRHLDSKKRGFHGLVSQALSFGRSSIRRLPSIKLLLPFLTKTRYLSTAPRPGSTFDLIVSDSSPSRIVIISLSYTSPLDGAGACPELYGTRNDFILMLQHYGYLHGDTSGRFILLNDFDTTFKDSIGVEKLIPKTDTSKKAIEKALKERVSATSKSSGIVLYFAGHGVEEEGPPEFSTTAEALSQAIISGNGERIYGPELRSWLSAGANPSVSVTAIFDTCTSAGILGLPYRYEYCSNGVQAKEVSGDEVPITMVEIAAAQRGQDAYSEVFGDKMHGLLTMSLIRYSKHTKHPTLEGLAYHLHTKLDPFGEQVPQVSSSAAPSPSP